MKKDANWPRIGIITALPKEFVAVKTILENIEEYTLLGRGAGRRYILGSIPSYFNNNENHRIVLALAGVGNNIAAVRATLLLGHFPNVQDIIMTGIAGGIPNPFKPEEHVRLGDIVVSNAKGIVQYDFDNETVTETSPRFPYRPPSATLLEAVDYLKILELEKKERWNEHIEGSLSQLNWKRPDISRDRLFDTVNTNQFIPHPYDPKRTPERRVFYGPIASANKLLKNPVKRDSLREAYATKAVEMEGSGVADATWYHNSGYLVVRGVCDYCDLNKGDDWQEYAAITAASYTRTLLETMPVELSKEGAAESEETDHKKHWHILLEIHYQNLHYLEIVAAKQGSAVSLSVINQINDEKDEIKEDREINRICKGYTLKLA